MKKVCILYVGLFCGLFAWAQDASKFDMRAESVNVHSSMSSTNTAFLVSSIPLYSAAESNLSAADPSGLPANPTPQFGAPSTNSDVWHGTVSIYGWFPGMHGTVGIFGHDAGVHKSFSDVFHFLKGVLPIAVEADKGRFVMPIDYLWSSWVMIEHFR